MSKTRTQRIFLDGNGEYLGMSKGCFVVRNRNGEEVERYPLFENQIKEVVLKSGNSVSTGALSSLGFWDIDVMVAHSWPMSIPSSGNSNSFMSVSWRALCSIRSREVPLSNQALIVSYVIK